MNDFEHELDKIRGELYEQTKHLTNAEAARMTNERGRRLAEQYGLKSLFAPRAIPVYNHGDE
jgi:hypothetical protein